MTWVGAIPGRQQRTTHHKKRDEDSRRVHRDSAVATDIGGVEKRVRVPTYGHTAQQDVDEVCRREHRAKARYLAFSLEFGRCSNQSRTIATGMT